MSLTESIKRQSLHEELVERVRNLVVDNTLKPGEKVPEKDLCEAFGVSRTPLREALKVLASEGLIVLQANRGARVTRVTREELDKTFPVIAALEQLAGELACQRLDDAGIERIEAEHAAMMKAFHAGDRQSYFLANQNIHNALIEAADNDILEMHHRMLAVRVRRARFMANLSDARWVQAIEEHEQMIARLRDRDAVGLGQLMKTHMLNKRQAHFAALDAGAGNETDN
ncbi:GntR family transcriptional regulator [Marivita sp. GX14005]|uniref:GntR family transcriptional regulator n=1 Tax=Marivita sp. GX14005 TaxID=2942276 RepID=UPI002018F96F|nr:GntR family transcriptional regulator [Marivita sp. GX14005]MCL3883200.1 GntR family transcriptional regulator [Marivita sp. GX14005]